MSVFFRKDVEVRSSGSWAPLFNTGGESPISGGKFKTALSVVAVYAAVSLIADAVASSPWAAFDKSDGVPRRSARQPMLLTDPGVFGLDLYSWRFQYAASLGIWGNAYGLVLAVDAGGVPSKVAWLRPDRVQVEEKFGKAPEYFYEGKRLESSSLIHIPLFVVPGSVVGLSPIGQFSTQIQTGLEAAKTGKNFFRRGAVPGAVLKNTSKTLTAENAAETKRRFVASTSSSEPFVTGMDWDYQTIPLPSSDVNFIQGAKWTANQVAAVYRVDPQDIGGEVGGSTLKYATLEMNELQFNTRTLRPYVTRTESVFDRWLPDTQYVKTNLDARVRADLKTRYQAHQIALQSGFKTVDEVRALEDLPPLAVSAVPVVRAIGSGVPLFEIES